MQSVQSLLPSVLPELLKQGPLSPAKLELAWKVAVGNALTRVTQVELGSSSTVLVRVPTEHWRREVHRSAGIILSRLQSLLGKDAVTRLQVSTRNSEPKVKVKT